MALSVILAVGLPAAMAGDAIEVDPRVLSAFQKEFSPAKDVTWEVGDEHSMARFLMYDQHFIAYFTNSGELIGTARNILYIQLPLSIIKQLENRYTEVEITSITEFTRDGETSYYLQATGKGKKLLLQAFSSGQISVVRKIRNLK